MTDERLKEIRERMNVPSLYQVNPILAIGDIQWLLTHIESFKPTITELVIGNIELRGQVKSLKQERDAAEERTETWRDTCGEISEQLASAEGVIKQARYTVSNPHTGSLMELQAELTRHQEAHPAEEGEKDEKQA